MASMKFVVYFYIFHKDKTNSEIVGKLILWEKLLIPPPPPTPCYCFMMMRKLKPWCKFLYGLNEKTLTPAKICISNL